MSELIFEISKLFHGHWEWLFAATVKVTVWLLLTIVVLRLLQKTSASLRHAVAVCAAVGVPLIFILSLSSIPDQFGWRPLARTKVVQQPIVEVNVLKTEGVVDALPVKASAQPAGSSTKSSVHLLDLRLGFVALWWLGCGIVGVRVLRQLRLPHIYNSVSTVPEHLKRALDREVHQQGLRQSPKLLIASDAMPMTFGLRNAVVVLPVEALEWSAEKLSSILRHELAHIRRRDLWWIVLVEISLLPVWWHPLARIVRRKVEEQMEQACDDAVIYLGTEPADYAADLLSLSRRLMPVRMGRLRLLAMSTKGQGARFKRLLNDDTSREGIGPFRLVVISLAAFSLLAPATLLTSCATKERSEGSVLHLDDNSSSLIVPPEIVGVPEGAQQLMLQVNFFGISLPAAESIDDPAISNWIAGGQAFLSPEKGFGFFYPGQKGVDIATGPKIVLLPGNFGEISIIKEILSSPPSIEGEVETVNVGIEFKARVWPTSDPSLLRADFNASVSEVVGHEKDETGFNVPQISRLEKHVTAAYPNGSFILLGSRDLEIEIRDKVPLFGDLPVLGRFFESFEVQRESMVVAVQIIVSEAPRN